MSIADALSRIGQIEQQLTQLRTGETPTTSTSATGTSGTSATTPASFSTALAQASGTTGTPSTVSALGSTSSVYGTSGLASTVSGGAATGSASLPPAATSMLTSGQQQFASELASQTGLNPGVISAWVLSEESGNAAQSRQAAGNNDWLNIGYTDSGTYGSADSVWSDPVAAADATAGWLKGQNTIPGYGTASSGIQAILGTAGQTPAAQIAALQGSGWASSGYPSLPALYTQVTA